ncbi:hypothetical protein MYCTH_101019 [Thermothelomyces thermophilus ATCC 42464]|uniref:Uncharacterized protein n=1 Tax=Thermothelomyces thermophilus (strain ATCC 42464 / BCRC 31852 / DSM 1799) TaxID=573729 RepID=G2Q7B1_THET4|nr:uncharacterized protein MYCTH_101019 [Thermothelomyces thermophilus ATCC 42464]AEO56022.1 hypothetical protein MYCTH_101019 [Thermothelomyces thermophilus ATCC 42464]
MDLYVYNARQWQPTLLSQRRGETCKKDKTQRRQGKRNEKGQRQKRHHLPPFAPYNPASQPTLVDRTSRATPYHSATFHLPVPLP